MPTEGDIADSEVLARFILFRKWIRIDETVKPEALLPTPDLELSVFRHNGMAEDELWRIGKEEVADKRKTNLYGGQIFWQVSHVSKTSELYHKNPPKITP